MALELQRDFYYFVWIGTWHSCLYDNGLLWGPHWSPPYLHAWHSLAPPKVEAFLLIGNGRQGCHYWQPMKSINSKAISLCWLGSSSFFFFFFAFGCVCFGGLGWAQGGTTLNDQPFICVVKYHLPSGITSLKDMVFHDRFQNP